MAGIKAKICFNHGRNSLTQSQYSCQGSRRKTANCLKSNLRYTRYADDIAISGEDITVEHIKLFRNIIKLSDYKFNEKKTNILRNGSRKVVTGVVVNEKLQAPRPTRRKFRQVVYYIERYGIDGHLRQIDELRNNYLDHLIGVGQHILWLNPKDKSAREGVSFLKNLRASYEN
jgi:RNA-directed DNA polymerase